MEHTNSTEAIHTTEPTMTKYTDKYGYERIAAVEVQYDRDQDGVVEYSIIWIVTKAGDVFARDMLIGEDEEQVAAYYRKRGTTDDKSYFFAPLSRKPVSEEYARMMSRNDNT
jgi:hypothetical protein